jgi:hypothetical protein
MKVAYSPQTYQLAKTPTAAIVGSKNFRTFHEVIKP